MLAAASYNSVSKRSSKQEGSSQQVEHNPSSANSTVLKYVFVFYTDFPTKAFVIFNILCREMSLASREVPVKQLNCHYLRNIGECQCLNLGFTLSKMFCNLNTFLDLHQLYVKCDHT